MRLVWLCFLLLGAFALNTRRHHGAYLSPTSLAQTSDVAGGTEAPAPVCNYVVNDDARYDDCPTVCVPADHDPTFLRVHYSLDSENCPTYSTWEECPGVTRCGLDEWPSECQVSFGPWSECSATCGGGYSQRSRSLPLNCLGCHHCDVEYKSCNTQACGRDCVLLDWNDWSECSVSCMPTNPVPATQTRTRLIRQGLAPGRICDPTEYFETRSCDPQVPQCSVDCVASDWTAWGDCSATCGCGVQFRTRTVAIAQQGYGAPCPYLSESRSCFCVDCPQPCQYSEWSYSPCSGDCYVNTTIDGETVIEYPERRKIRYILREAKGGMPSCNQPCELAKTEQCKNVPQCPDDCKLSPWGPWLGSCPPCLSPGVPVPVQIRERSIIQMGNGICGCTRQERVCDIPWCCEDCIVGNWTEWGPCIPTSTCVAGSQSGVRTRTREVLRPANRCGARCPDLQETQDCSMCCPVDCEVGAWVGWMSATATNQCGKLVNGVPVPIDCGTERGIIRYTRTISKRPNACGAPCPETQRDVGCFPPYPCCPVNCTMGEDQYSDCYGCGNNARRWLKKTVINYESCGGVPCCYYGGCALFRPVACEAPVPLCPQTPCVYGEWGNYSACSASCAASGGGVPQMCRQRHLINQPDGETCPGQLVDCTSCNTQCCPVNCQVGDWGPWGSWEPACGLQVRSRTRPILVSPSCGGAFCPPLVNHDTQTTCCPVDCVVDDWGSWSLCPSCVPDGESPKSQTRSRKILIQAGCGGGNCPTELSQTRTCPSTPCDRNCEVGPFSEWGPCNAGCGDGFQTRMRVVTVTKLGYGMDCPPLVETQHCYIPCPNCVLGALEYGDCTPSCSNSGAGTRRVTRNSKPLTLEDGTTLEMCNVPPTTEPCTPPCCPVDCQMTPWSEWSPCVDGVKSRTRSVLHYDSCGGSKCPVCRLEKDVCSSPPVPGECEFGEACEEGVGAA